MREDGQQENRQEKPRKRGRWLKRLGILLVLCALFLAWLSGPGIRWLGPKVATHFLRGAGFEGSFELDGNLLGGLAIKEIDLAGDAKLSVVKAGSIRPLYRLSGLANGQVDGIEIDDLHLELQLDAGRASEEDAAEEEEDGAPMDMRRIVEQIRSVRPKILPASMKLDDLSFKVMRGEDRVFELAESDIRHEPGSETIRIDLGTITDASGREWPAQASELKWNEDSIALDRIDPLPGIGVRDVRLETPAGGEPSVELDLLVDDAAFDVALSPGFEAAVVQLREGKLSSGPLLDRFGIKVPVSTELSSFSATVDGILPDPAAATGELRVTLENIVSGEWTVPELSVDAKLDGSEAKLAARASALGTEISLDAAAPLNRGGGSMILGNASGDFRVANVPALVADLAERFDAIRKDATVPESQVEGKFTIDFDNNKPAAADAAIALQPQDPQVATAFGIQLAWKPDAPIAADLSLDGLKAKATVDTAAQRYQAELALDRFDSRRIAPWLAIPGIDLGGDLGATATWSGSGTWEGMEHKGEIAVPSITFAREDAPTIEASLETATYRWPGEVRVDGLRAAAGGQRIATGVRLADGWLELVGLDWSDGDTRLAGGNAKLPVPDDFARWRDTLAGDERPLAVDLRTESLGLRRLSDWVPAAAGLNDEAMGQALVQLSGTYADPVVNATVELRNLKAPDQPDLPPADIKITIAAKEKHLGVNANIVTPDFEPAVVTASMPFRPAEWAGNPELIREETVTARADLPRISLDRFQNLAPGVEKLAGILTGNIEIAGRLGDPDIKGNVELTNAAVTLAGEKYPPIENAGLAIEVVPGKAELRNLRATIAGGSLSGGGTLALEEWKPGALDIRITGTQLPVVRDESVLVRSNLDLRLSGPFESATVSGSAEIVDSLFYQDIELIPIGVPFTGPSAASLPKIDPPDEQAARIPAPFDAWNLDFRVRTAEPFLIRGNLATGEVDVDIRVGGNLGDPAPEGFVRLREVTALLPFTTLRVREGWLRFTPANGLDPVLEVRGTANPRPYRINVFVYGNVSNPQIVLTSSPPLPENEIMTLLATGTTTSGLEDPQMASSRAVQLLLEELRRGRLGGSERLRPLLGLLDNVEFSLSDKNPYTSENYTSATIQLADKWFLAASIGEENNTRLMGIWRLTFR